MANRDWRKSRARCPYYYTSTARTITCSCGESGMKGAKFIGESQASCADWFGQKCATNYAGCPIFRMIDRIVTEALMGARPVPCGEQNDDGEGSG